LPHDSGANARRSIEIAKLALALKREPDAANEWLKAGVRQARWDARQRGAKAPRLPNVHFPLVDSDPLFVSLKEYFGIASDMHVHFTPEFFGNQHFQERPTADGGRTIELDYFASEGTVLLGIIGLCGIHARILAIFNACFDGVVSTDPGWRLLEATFQQLVSTCINRS